MIKDEATKRKLGEIYARNGEFMINVADRLEGGGHGKKVFGSKTAYLVENFAKAPALVIAAIWGIHDNSGRPGLFDSVIQSAWSFNLTLVKRGLGSTWTTLLNASVDELAGILGIPDGITTIVTFPVAYAKGTEFKPAVRRQAEQITYFDRWGFTARASEDRGVNFEDGLGVVAEVDIESDPSEGLAFISDIEFPVDASEELQGAAWNGEARGLGATFTGHNKLGDMEWSIENHVTDYVEGRVFEWGTVDPASPGGRWRFEIMDQGVGSRLRFSMEIGTENNLTIGFAEASENPVAVIQWAAQADPQQHAADLRRHPGRRRSSELTGFRLRRMRSPRSRTRGEEAVSCCGARSGCRRQGCPMRRSAPERRSARCGLPGCSAGLPRLRRRAVAA